MYGRKYFEGCSNVRVYHSVQAELAEPVYDTNGIRNLSGCKADYTRVYGMQCGPFNWGASCCRPQMGINNQPTSGGYKNKNENEKQNKNKKRMIENKITDIDDLFVNLKLRFIHR